MAATGKKNLERAQVRSERVTVMLTPGTSDGVKMLARAKGLTVSDLISSLIDTVVKKNAAVIEEYAAAQIKFAAAINLTVAENEAAPAATADNVIFG